jgi:hypothetical protein
MPPATQKWKTSSDRAPRIRCIPCFINVNYVNGLDYLQLHASGSEQGILIALPHGL